MSSTPTITTFDRSSPYGYRTVNMPSLARMLEVLKPTAGATLCGGMNATVPVAKSVRITRQAPVVMGPHDDCCGCGCEGCGDGDLEDD